jgi:hydroxymethylbilane synthase
MKPLRVGTRGSPLALWQARHVAMLLQQAWPGLECQLTLIETRGDRITGQSLAEIAQAGFGVFTKEIQAALLDGRADIAVHSLKDLPTVPVPGVTLAATPPRGPVGDVFVSKRYPSASALPPGARVATSSLRRRSQLLHHRPGVLVEGIRGNVETRLRKLDELGLDGILLAEAGLHRLGLGHLVTEVCSRDWCLPAVGQGAIGLECREDDTEARELLARINDLATLQAVTAERSFLAALGGGCLVPIGAHATQGPGGLSLRGVVLDPEGSRRVADELSGSSEAPSELGEHLAQNLLAAGAKELLSR